jgi:lysophospholipase L1-like esterase
MKTGSTSTDGRAARGRHPGDRRSGAPDRRGGALVRYAAWWLVPLSLVVASLLAEGLLRAFPSLLPEEAQLRLAWSTQTPVNSIGDPDLGFLYPPNHHQDFRSGDIRFSVDSDEHGFRNPSPWPKTAEIVVLGDSMAYGWGVEGPEAWYRLLEKSLPAGRVISLGLPGTMPLQNLRYYERFGTGLKPRVVIFSIFPGNDFGDTSTFTRWLDAGSPGNYDVWRFFEGAVPPDRPRLMDRSRLLLLLRSVVKNLRYGMSSRTLTLAGGAKIQLVPALYARSILRNDSSDPAFQDVVQATLEARKLARSEGAEFVTLLFPTKEAVYLPMHGTPFPSLTQPLAKALEDDGVPCIDLTDRFRELAAGNAKLYFELDGHPNQLGNQVIADTVLAYLRAHAKSIGPAD